MTRLGVEPSRVKHAAGWMLERLGRLRLSETVTRNPGTFRLMQIETLSLGLEGKRLLWKALQGLTQAGAEGGGIDVGVTSTASSAEPRTSASRSSPSASRRRRAWPDEIHHPRRPSRRLRRPTHTEGETQMGIGVSVFLFAVGAILTFAVDATVSGLDLATVGVILMIAGALGLIMTLAVFAPRRSRRETVVDDGYGNRRVTRDDIV